MYFQRDSSEYVTRRINRYGDFVDNTVPNSKMCILPRAYGLYRPPSSALEEARVRSSLPTDSATHQKSRIPLETPDDTDERHDKPKRTECLPKLLQNRAPEGHTASQSNTGGKRQKTQQTACQRNPSFGWQPPLDRRRPRHTVGTTTVYGATRNQKPSEMRYKARTNTTSTGAAAPGFRRSLS